MAKRKIAAPPAWLVAGAIVDYCSIIGRAPTEHAMVVRHGPQQLGHGDWVVWLHGKSGAVSVLACQPAESNDAPPDVQVEIQAAELELASTGRTVGERWGWEAHEDGRPVQADDYERSGWLHRELVTHADRETRDADAWSWDVTRQVAGQLEEQLASAARGQKELERLQDVRDSRIAEQTRHDVAESVRRHAALESPGDAFMRRTAHMEHVTSDDMRTVVGGPGSHRAPGRVPYAVDQSTLPVVSEPATAMDAIEPPDAIPCRLRRARGIAGLALQQAARRLEIPSAELDDIERGHETVASSDLRRMAEVYGVSVVWLQSGDGAPLVAEADDLPMLAPPDAVIVGGVVVGGES